MNFLSLFFFPAKCVRAGQTTVRQGKKRGKRPRRLGRAFSVHWIFFSRRWRRSFSIFSHIFKGDRR